MDDETKIRAMVESYFCALHLGDVVQLATLFAMDCVLKTPGQRRTCQRWLADVASRPVPQQIGHPWQYRIIWVELAGDQAMAKVNCPLPHGQFTDYLGLLKEEGEWKIVNKMYALTTGF